MTAPGDIREDALRIREIAEKLNQTVGACFGKVAEVRHSRTAIIGESWRPTYTELDAASNSLARVLLERGADTGDRVAILMRHDAPQIAAVLAVLKAGCTVVVLNPTDPPARLGQVLDDAEPSILLTDLPNREQASLIGDKRQAVVCFEDHPAGVGVTAPEIHADPGSVAMLVYTSGSTGRPKGVMRTHGDFIHQVLRFTCGLGLDPGDKIALLASLSGGQGMITTWSALLNGAVLCPFPVVEVGLNGLADWMVRNRITNYFSSASLFRHFMRTLPEGFKFPDVRLVRLGSEPATSADFALYREHFGEHSLFFHTFSSSETGSILHSKLAHDDLVCEGRLPAGNPAEGVEVMLLDASGKEISDGETGEITVRSRHLAAGYWRDEKMTRERFITTSSSGGAVIFRTGDLGRRTGDGQIQFVGRADERVKVRGYRIELSEVEDALRAQAPLEHAVVLASALPGEDSRIVAFVTLRAGQTSTANALRAALRTVLPDHMVPTQFVFLDQIPLTPHGKTNREKLRNIIPEVSAPADMEKPATPTETMLAVIWNEVFKQDAVGRESDFFELGGDSLVAAVVAARVHAERGMSLSLRSFADHPTLAAFAKLIDELAKENIARPAPRLTRAPRDAPLPLSYHQERLWRFSQTPQGTAGYIMSHECRLRGKLNVEILRQSLTYLLERHEILRTTIEEISGRPVQMVHSPRPVEMMEYDFSRSSQPGVEAMEARREEAVRPIDLQRGPLLRFILSRLSEDEYWLQSVHHHIISDGQSWHVFFRELGLIYDSLIRRQSPPLPRVETLQYGDYAAWQRNNLRPDSEAWSNLLAWWKGVFANAPRPLELPFRRPVANPDASANEGVLARDVPEETARRLARLAHKETATFYAVRLAAFCALLSAANSRPDILIGAYASDRNSVETQNMFGFFSNLTTLRLSCNGTLSFRQWLAVVSEAVNEAQAHSALPYEQMCEELRRQGLVLPEVRLLAKVGTHRDVLKLEGVEIDWPAKLENLTMPWGFTMSFFQRNSGECCVARFDASIYDPAGAGAMADDFVRLLTESSLHPDSTLATLAGVSAVARTSDGMIPTNSQASNEPVPGCAHANSGKLPAFITEADARLHAAATRITQLLGTGARAIDGRIAGLMQPDGPLFAALRSDPRRVAVTVPKQRISMTAGMNNETLFQFHDVEFAAGKDFRWSRPVCAVKVYPPRHSDKVTLRLHPFVPATAPPALWLEGRSLAFMRQHGLSLEYIVPEKCIPSRPAWLVIVAEPIQSNGDTRSLGLPLHRIKFDSPAVAKS